jgi:hypothetical protein
MSTGFEWDHVTPVDSINEELTTWTRVPLSDAEFAALLDGWLPKFHGDENPVQAVSATPEHQTNCNSEPADPALRKDQRAKGIPTIHSTEFDNASITRLPIVFCVCFFYKNPSAYIREPAKLVSFFLFSIVLAAVSAIRDRSTRRHPVAQMFR